MSTRSAKPQRQSQHTTRRAERPSRKPGKENADPKVSNAVTSSRPSKVKRIVDSFSTSERDSKDAPDPDLVARVARVTDNCELTFRYESRVFQIEIPPLACRCSCVLPVRDCVL